MRRISISNLNASDIDPRYPAMIVGIPGCPIEDVRLTNIQLHYRGGLDLAVAARQPADLANGFFQRTLTESAMPAKLPIPQPREPFAIPERDAGYPEPSMFGILPVYGLFVRHAKNVTLDNITISYQTEDKRPVLFLEDVSGLSLSALRLQKSTEARRLILHQVSDLTLRSSTGLPDARETQITFGTY